MKKSIEKISSSSFRHDRREVLHGRKNQKTVKVKTVRKPVTEKRVSALLNLHNAELLARLEKFVVEKNGHALKDLAESIGVDRSFFTTSKRQNSAIGSDKLMKILRHYPELSADWLLKGTGAMLVGTKSDDDVDYRFAMDRFLARLDMVVGGLSDSVDNAYGIIQKMKKAQKGIGFDS